MCILFIYNGSKDFDSDYSLILISNRDEFYDRPTQSMAPWSEDSNVYGGRDLKVGCNNGTWLAVNQKHDKIGIILNLPGDRKDNAKSRGAIIADYVKSNLNVYDYIKSIKNYTNECNDFTFVSVEYGNLTPKIVTYNNVTNETIEWSDTYLGFSNSLPENPLKKVQIGTNMLKSICSKFNKIIDKENLIDELLYLLKNEERNSPDDHQLEKGQLYIYKELSSIFVKVPISKYGTRAHTILLISKTGFVDLIEISMKSPINIEDPQWERNYFQFESKLKQKI